MVILREIESNKRIREFKNVSDILEASAPGCVILVGTGTDDSSFVFPVQPGQMLEVIN
jgi:hypothetical protein